MPPPELGVPVTKPEAEWWETCMTINNSWGYQKADTNFKSPSTVLRMLVDCINLGGNLLLDIGPRADGSIPRRISTCSRSSADGHPSTPRPSTAPVPASPPDMSRAYTSLSPDSRTLYVYLPYKPTGQLRFKGLKSKVKSARVVGNDTPVTWDLYNDISWSEVPGVYYFNIPEEALDPEITVVALELEEPASLYRGHGG